MFQNEVLSPHRGHGDYVKVGSKDIGMSMPISSSQTNIHSPSRKNLIRSKSKFPGSLGQSPTANLLGNGVKTNQRRSMERNAVTSLSNYDNLKLESMVNPRTKHNIPVHSDQRRYQLYKPEEKNFDDHDTKKIIAYENQGQEIKQLDLAISPFLKNQNDHMQRMHQSVARQE